MIDEKTRKQTHGVYDGWERLRRIQEDENG